MPFIADGKQGLGNDWTLRRPTNRLCACSLICLRQILGLARYFGGTVKRVKRRSFAGWQRKARMNQFAMRLRTACNERGGSHASAGHYAFDDGLR